MKTHFPKNIIFWGGTGQAKVNRPIVEYYGAKLAAVFDDTPGLKKPFADTPLYRGWDGFLKWSKGKNLKSFGFIICIGNPHGRIRIEIAGRLKKAGLAPVTLIHPRSFVADNAVLGQGCQVMAGAVVQPEARIGEYCIINTLSSVDHECVVGDGSEVAPGAVLCGDVRLGINVWVGAGAVVLSRISIGADTVVGAGAVVTKNIPAKKTVVGIPARSMSKKRQHGE